MIDGSATKPPDLSAQLDGLHRGNREPLPMPAPNDDRTVQSSRTGGRKAYQAPKLCCYGDVGAITQNVGNTNKALADGGPHNMDKTH